MPVIQRQQMEETTTYRDIINSLSNEDLADIIVNGDIIHMACLDYSCTPDDEDTCEGCVLRLLERQVDDDNPLIVR